MRGGTELAREIQLTDWSTAGNLSNRSSGVEIPRDNSKDFSAVDQFSMQQWLPAELGRHRDV